MEVDHDGLDVGVAEILLDDPQVDPGLQEMGGVGVAEGVDGDALLVDAGGKLGPPQPSLHPFDGHGDGGLSPILRTHDIQKLD